MAEQDIRDTRDTEPNAESRVNRLLGTLLNEVHELEHQLAPLLISVLGSSPEQPAQSALEDRLDYLIGHVRQIRSRLDLL